MSGASDESIAGEGGELMTPSQRILLRQTIEDMVPLPRQFGLRFYERLFELDPGLRELFRDDVERQATMLVDALTLSVLRLLDEGRASCVVRELGTRHRAYGVLDEHYDTFGDALTWTLAERLGERFTPELSAAWGEAWREIATAMREAPASGVH